MAGRGQRARATIAHMSVDLDSYFARIGYQGPRTPELATLRGIISAHTSSIPFENWGPLLGQPVLLDLPSLEAKLVHARRGGYCFEQNALLQDVLSQLGFGVQGLSARVLWRQPPDAQTARSHMLLRVEIGSDSYIADVGFGALTLTAPLALSLDVTQATPHEPFRLAAHARGLDMQAQLSDGFVTLYRFTLEPAFPADYEVGNYYTSRHPKSHFTQRLMMALAVPGRRYTLVDNLLSEYVGGRAPERTLLRDAGALARVIREQLKLELPDTPEVSAQLTRLASTPAP